MKPSWDDAPEWANWLAQDSDGSWEWYEVKPKLKVGPDEAFWLPEKDTQWKVASYGDNPPELPLEPRP